MAVPVEDGAIIYEVEVRGHVEARSNEAHAEDEEDEGVCCQGFSTLLGRRRREEFKMGGVAGRNIEC